jgi:arylsulfatase A-like enzyme
MPDRPNIVVVLCDQMRRDAMSCAGDPNVATPNLDGLAADGARFTNASATYPICVPSRFTFVTGEYAHTRKAHHIWRMSPTETTFADVLSDAGYHTAWIGKWHLSDTPHRPVPPSFQGGFDHWRGFSVRNAPFDTDYYEDDDPTPRPVEGYQTDGLFDLAMEYLDDRAPADQPFCLIVSIEPPHPPYFAPRTDMERWESKTLELRENVPYPDEALLPERYDRWGDPESASASFYDHPGYLDDVLFDDLRRWYAMIENLDANVGRLVTALEQREMREETALMFTADHGDLHGSHGLTQKQHPYEESVGVPLILSYPEGDIDDGRTVSEPTSGEDWYPTILGLGGIDTPEKPGRDLTPLARGDRDGFDRRGVLLEFVREIRADQPYHDGGWRGLRTERYKYTVRCGPDEGAEPWQLFDLRDDPFEMHNLVQDPEYEPVARDLHGALRERLDRTGDDVALAPAFGHEALHLRNDRTYGGP